MQESGTQMDEHNVVPIEEALARRGGTPLRMVSRRRALATSRSRIAADAAVFNAASILEAARGDAAQVASRVYPRKRLG